MAKICRVILTVALLAACGAPPVRRPHVANPAASPATGVVAYRIDSARSELRLLVYRAGPLARFGHNHVIINRALEGRIDAAEPVSSSGLSVRVPVAAFVVDDAQARGKAGPDFSEPVSEDAKSGTRHNMLSAALLDAERFPSITLASIAVYPAPGSQMPGKLVAKLAVDVAGHESTLEIPFTLERSQNQLSAWGTVVLRQSEMGLTPFSLMLGALKVQDEVTIEFRLLALRT